MGKYILYSHAGSENHGCEALLRTSLLTMQDVDAVYSGDVDADRKYGLEKLIKILPDKTEGFENLVSKLIYSVKYHLKKQISYIFRMCIEILFVVLIQIKYIYLSVEIIIVIILANGYRF